MASQFYTAIGATDSGRVSPSETNPFIEKGSSNTKWYLNLQQQNQQQSGSETDDTIGLLEDCAKLANSKKFLSKRSKNRHSWHLDDKTKISKEM